MTPGKPRFIPSKRTFKVWHDGDRSVGVEGDSAIVTMTIHSEAMLDDVFGTLNETFSTIWDVYGKYVYVDLEETL